VTLTAPGGWSAEVIDLECTTPPRSPLDPLGDGPQLLVRQHGKTMGFVRTVGELGQFFADEGLAICP
jgi:hypothetical protein